VTFVNDHKLVAKIMQQPNIFRFDIAFCPQANKLFRLGIPPEVQVAFHKMTVGGLHGVQLDQMTSAYVKHLHAMLSGPEYAQKDWQRLNGKSFVEQIVFGAAARAVIGDYDDFIHSFEVRGHFDKVDESLNYMMIAPEMLLGRIRRSQQFVSSYLARLPRGSRSDFMNSVLDFFDAHVPNTDHGRVLFMTLWAVNANSQPGVMWTLMYLLRDEVAKAELTQEVAAVVLEDEGWVLHRTSALPQLAPSSLRKMKKVQSYILDCIRIQSCYLGLRKVSEDTTIEVKSNAADSAPQRYHFSSGDIVMACNQHNRTDIFPQVDKPLVDRFLPVRVGESDVLLPPVFKDVAGVEVTTANTSFGMGRDVCPGKHFFLAEATAIVATLLLSFDVQLAVPDAPLPRSNRSRIGLVQNVDPAFHAQPPCDILLRKK
jgi:hypothetical protein